MKYFCILQLLLGVAYFSDAKIIRINNNRIESDEANSVFTPIKSGKNPADVKDGLYDSTQDDDTKNEEKRSYHHALISAEKIDEIKDGKVRNAIINMKRMRDSSKIAKTKQYSCRPLFDEGLCKLSVRKREQNRLPQHLVGVVDKCCQMLSNLFIKGS